MTIGRLRSLRCALYAVYKRHGIQFAAVDGRHIASTMHLVDISGHAPARWLTPDEKSTYL